jgi:KDO2-lipid IV(A) lauroyltransferase
MVELLTPETRASAMVQLGKQVAAQLEEAVGRGRGVVFATVHHGLMDWMAAAVAEAGYDVWTVARESYDPRLTGLYEQLRAPRGVKTIYRGQPGAHVRLVRALRAGGLVGFPMDFAGRGVATVPCSFLGEPTALPVGPARIAVRTGSAVLVGAPVRNSGCWQLSAEPIEIPEPDEPNAADVLTRRIAHALEARVRAEPLHWPWMHDGAAPSHRLPAPQKRRYT